MRRVAIIGAGISGLAAAHALGNEARVTVFEAADYFGGHAHTVDVTLPDAQGRAVSHGVDTGFLVFNHRTYPNLVRLFERLQVPTAPSEMSFSVQVHQQQLEWAGNNLDSVFAQRSNLLRPRFLGMLADILRFNRLATALAQAGDQQQLAQPIADFLDRHHFGAAFRDWYFLPMIGCIWSCPCDQMLRFPVATMVNFCHNHGLLQVADRPQWYTVQGGSRQYVARLLAALPNTAQLRLQTPVRRVQRLQRGQPVQGGGGVVVSTDHGSERFDDVVLACHAGQSLQLLGDASPQEHAVLGAIRTQPNRAVLHTDASVLPRRRRAWAAWNYARAQHTSREGAAVCLHYLINRLQPLPWQQPVIVSLNPDPAHPIDPARVLGDFDYSHPVFDAAAISAQQQLPALQGGGHVWFCGAWTRYGFHEDGLASALDVAAQLRQAWAPATPADLAVAA